ncbi:ribose-phosphate diphosphokinase [Thiohalomonas denitrificans]|uniref:ribose-phosphate diphosphokinase n=1 Tax=Thiohalomonas denitrificans TaxID=415747 RepID=A0A1G5PHU6_9GAMM|nr:ribose-phosphate pyrophosphokinase [Thiohalomonas denitrificans]SCZ49092.1 ribose-phosphate pyrophosphokinase [Thiohalomonas denitrificans]
MASIPMLFALEASREFGESVARTLEVPLSEHEEREFEDGEHKARPLVEVRNRHAYVVQSLHGRGGQSVDEKLVRLLFFIGALKESGAARVTAVLPYLCYARKDRRTKPHDPVTTRYVAMLFEAVGTDGVLAVDVHNPSAFENAFRCSTEHLEARHVFVAPVADFIGADDALVLSPDAGGVKRAERFREVLERHLKRPAGNGFMEKKRSGGVVSGEQLVGDVTNKTIIIVDDLIAGGTTLARAAEACKKRGARRMIAVATHGVFAPGADDKLGQSPLEHIFIGDTIPPAALDPAFLQQRVEVIGLGPFIAEAIRRLHGGESLADLSQVYGY